MTHKIWIVLKSEFLRRVKSKWFIMTTLLGPVALVAFFVIVGFVSVSALKGDARTVAVVDETGMLLSRLLSAEDEQHRLVSTEGMPIDSVRAAVLDGRYDGYLALPAGVLTGGEQPSYYAVEGGGFGLESWLEGRIERAVEEHRLSEQNVGPEVLDILRTNVSLSMVKLSDTGETAGNTGFYIGLGFIMGFLIYMTMIIYGSVVMQGVIEEKTSRVVEVVISSVRPFYLLMGKVLGIGAMGLVQILFWVVLMVLGVTFAGSILGLFLDPADLNLSQAATQQEVLEAAGLALPHISPFVFVWFVLFFLFGYLLYASLFAAVGAAVEQQQDAQAILFPIMLPLIVAIVFIEPMVESPQSTLAVTLSLIPFTAPIAMVVRVAVTDVPLWQSLLSFLLIVSTFIGAVWMSSRIYRVGILMYGKKPGIKDLVKWFRYA